MCCHSFYLVTECWSYPKSFFVSNTIISYYCSIIKSVFALLLSYFCGNHVKSKSNFCIPFYCAKKRRFVSEPTLLHSFSIYILTSYIRKCDTTPAISLADELTSVDISVTLFTVPSTSSLKKIVPLTVSSFLCAISLDRKSTRLNSSHAR